MGASESKLRWEVSRNGATKMVRLLHDGEALEFGGVPAIQSFALEHPEIPKQVVDKMLAQNGGYVHLVQDGDGVVLAHEDGVLEVAAATEAQAWADAAATVVAQHETISALRKGEAAQFVVGYWRGGAKSDQLEPMVGTAPPIGGVMQGVDGRTYDGIVRWEPLDATKHQSLSAIVRHGIYRLARNGMYASPGLTGPLAELSPDQREALIAFRARHGRSWKEKLLQGWMSAKYPGPLQAIRNQFGPEWLTKLKPSAFDVAGPGAEEVFVALVQMGEDASLGLAETVLSRMSQEACKEVAACGESTADRQAAIRKAIDTEALLRPVAAAANEEVRLASARSVTAGPDSSMSPV